jgi:hypothetical protein
MQNGMAGEHSKDSCCFEYAAVTALKHWKISLSGSSSWNALISVVEWNGAGLLLQPSVAPSEVKIVCCAKTGFAAHSLIGPFSVRHQELQSLVNNIN